MVDIDKNLTYDRQTNCCKLDEGKLIVKIIQKNTKNTIPANFPNQIRERMNMLPADIRMEMVGHEMVKVLFYGLRSIKCKYARGGFCKCLLVMSRFLRVKRRAIVSSYFDVVNMET